MKILVPLILVFITVILGLMFLNTDKAPYAKINGKTFSLYIAQTEQEREKGLSIFDSIPQNKGMLFIFNKEDYYTFWMKDMKFPIDIIFIDKNKIVEIFKNVPVQKGNDLPTYSSKEKSDRVLEINAGLSDKYGFKKGDSVTIKL